MNRVEWLACSDAESRVTVAILWCLVPGGKTGSGGGLLRKPGATVWISLQRLALLGSLHI